MRELINIVDVMVCYEDKKPVLRDVNLKIYNNDFMAVVGPNGGGKTSLVRAIMGVIPHRGWIQFSPELRNDKGVLQIGYMPQISLFDRSFPITLREVVLSGIPSHKGFLGRSYYTKGEINSVHELMERTSIAHLANNRISALSGGQLQRGLLCRAVISNPKLLILDEPTNFIDNNFEREFYVLLKELHRDMAIMMVSHDLGSVSSHVRQIVCVNGRVHRHDSNIITKEQLDSYQCPIQIITHGVVPHTVLTHHYGDGCCREKRGMTNK